MIRIRNAYTDELVLILKCRTWMKQEVTWKDFSCLTVRTQQPSFSKIDYRNYAHERMPKMPSLCESFWTHEKIANSVNLFYYSILQAWYILVTWWTLDWTSNILASQNPNCRRPSRFSVFVSVVYSISCLSFGLREESIISKFYFKRWKNYIANCSLHMTLVDFSWKASVQSSLQFTFTSGI